MKSFDQEMNDTYSKNKHALPTYFNELNTLEWLCAMLGRSLFENFSFHNENLQVFPSIIGPGGTGKSLLNTILSGIIGENNVGTVESEHNKDNKYILSDLYMRKMITIPDADDAFDIPQVMFQKMISGDPIKVARRYLNSVMIERWLIRIILFANYIPKFRSNNGAMLRRVLIFLYQNRISHRDDSFEHTILTEELGNILILLVIYYHKLVLNGVNHEHSKTGRLYTSRFLNKTLTKQTISSAGTYFEELITSKYTEDELVDLYEQNTLFNHYKSKEELLSLLKETYPEISEEEFGIKSLYGLPILSNSMKKARSNFEYASSPYSIILSGECSLFECGKHLLIQKNKCIEMVTRYLRDEFNNQTPSNTIKRDFENLLPAYGMSVIKVTVDNLATDPRIQEAGCRIGDSIYVGLGERITPLS